MWIDSHVHLVSDELFENIDDHIEQAKENGVHKLLVICGSMKEISRALEKLEGDAMFDLAIGVHPTSVQDISNHEFKEMMTYLDHPQVVAVGEIGLDYYWSTDFVELQTQRFIEQIKYANEYQLPVIIHSREAMFDLKYLLQNYPIDEKGVLHCFTGNYVDALDFIHLGYYLGFGGIVTFKNATEVKESLQVISIDRILTETDAPYLAPVPFRGKRNRPAYVMHTGEYIAKLKELDVSTFQRQTKENYKRLFKRSKWK